MNNPWIDFDSCYANEQYILPCDREAISQYNKKFDRDKTVADQLPGPHVGNPLTSTVLILSLNPGYNDTTDYTLHKRPDFSADLRKNLRHEQIEYPFYYLNPKYEDGGGYGYWYPFLKGVIDEMGGNDYARKLVANKVALIEWYPYRSNDFYWLKCLGQTQSQKYSHELAKRAINDKRVIVIHRALNKWKFSVERLDDGWYITHKSGKPPRNWYLSRENLKDGDFEKICAAIQK